MIQDTVLCQLKLKENMYSIGIHKNKYNNKNAVFLPVSLLVSF